jgi:hypothetical protein
LEVMTDYIRNDMEVESFEKNLNPWRMLLGKTGFSKLGKLGGLTLPQERKVCL